MNLYKHTFEHYSQKDSESGIKKYFVAKNAEEAYEIVYGQWGSKYENSVIEDMDPDDVDEEWYVTEEQAKAKVLEVGGDLNLKDGEQENWFQDLYYGLIIEGWELVKEDLSENDFISLRRLKIIEVEDA